VKQARVSHSVTRTLNLGNYESVKVQAGLEVQCDRKIEEETKAWQI